MGIVLLDHLHTGSTVIGYSISVCTAKQPKCDICVPQDREVPLPSRLSVRPLESCFLQNDIEHIAMVGKKESLRARLGICYGTSFYDVVECRDRKIHRPTFAS